jgi:hypothetical protein
MRFVFVHRIAAGFRYGMPALVMSASLLAFAPPAAAQTTVAPPTPFPTTSPLARATAKPSVDPLSFRGYFRAYDFTRQNAAPNRPSIGQVDQASFSMGVGLHAEYNVGAFTAGASYFYSNPLGPCAPVAAHTGAGRCSSALPLGSQRPDDTLPGYTLSTFDEAWVQYKANGLYAKIGDQLINTPWANASDSRLKPAAFQGADVSYAISKQFTIEAMDMNGFESRTNSTFERLTLLTATPSFSGASGLPANTPYGAPGPSTSGFQYGRLGYASPSFTANLHFYDFDELADLAWLDAKFTDQSQRSKPFLAIQAGQENSIQSAYLGKIDSDIFGAQIGGSPAKNIVVTLGYNEIPRRTDTITLPAGDTCTNATQQLKVKSGTTLPYFLGTNAPECQTMANGQTVISYGGIASPYTDSYATDPLFTTSLTQGMADRRAPGNGAKVAATYTSNNKRLTISGSFAAYNYGDLLTEQQTKETDADIQYLLNALRPGKPYKGLLLRYRYGARSIDHTTGYVGPNTYFGGLPYFVYNRAQLEYDF